MVCSNLKKNQHQKSNGARVVLALCTVLVKTRRKGKHRRRSAIKVFMVRQQRALWRALICRPLARPAPVPSGPLPPVVRCRKRSGVPTAGICCFSKQCHCEVVWGGSSLEVEGVASQRGIGAEEREGEGRKGCESGYGIPPARRWSIVTIFSVLIAGTPK